MSQILFDTEATDAGERIPVRVMGGWDPPMREYFLTLFRSDLDEDDYDSDEVLWSSALYPSKEDRRSTLRLKRKLMEYKITPPSTFWEEVEKRTNGNTIIAL